MYPTYSDLVYDTVGRTDRQSMIIKHGEQVYEDPILVKSDGLPTYHLANVVDDHHMKITHVIRAIVSHQSSLYGTILMSGVKEWMPSTPRHLALYEAFGWDPPAFAHVGLLLGDNLQKLSKRNLDMDIRSFKEQGFFPEALVNFVALLGWSHIGADFLPPDELKRKVYREAPFSSIHLTSHSLL